MEYIVGLVIIGFAALGMAWMPSLSNKIRISYSIVYIVLGIVVFSTIPLLPDPDPLRHQKFTVHLTEMVVLVALMGTGLKIDEPFSLRKWRYPFRLITIGMVGTIALTALVAWKLLGMDLPAAILLGAILSPTDPVLAADVQVGPPHEGVKDSAKFTLTAEGGMNDGIAFPFVWLGILLTNNLFLTPGMWLEWAGFYLVYKVICGLVVGYFFGKLVGYLLFSLPERYKAAQIEDGFVAISLTLLVYGTTELLKGYGFIAVFCCAVTLRNYEMGHELHRTLHAFSDQIERMLVAIILMLFGGSLISGALHYLTWPLALFGIGFVLVIRPLVVWLTVIKSRLKRKEKWVISFFGIRGIGSLYYMSFTLTHTAAPLVKSLWSTVAFVILISIIIHGLTAGTAIKELEKSRK